MAKWSQTKSHPNYGQAEAVVLHKAEELNAAGVRCVSMTVVGMQESSEVGMQESSEVGMQESSEGKSIQADLTGVSS